MNKARIIKIIFEDILNSLIVIYTNLLKGKLFKSFIGSVKTQKNLIVIGSGPSLKTDIEQIKSADKIVNDFIAFNSFINSTFSAEIMPNFYMLIDPAFFFTNKDLKNEDVKVKINNTWNKLERVFWDMNLLIPSKFKDSQRLKNITHNSKIRIVYIHEKPILGGSKILNYYLFRLGFGHPLLQNVLIGGVIFGISSKYESITIYGSDHSFHKLLEIDNKTNLLIHNEDSLGSEKSKVPFMDFRNNRPKISNFFQTLSITFRSYEILNYIAKKKNILIVNAASVSYIDAFKRK